MFVAVGKKGNYVLFDELLTDLKNKTHIVFIDSQGVYGLDTLKELKYSDNANGTCLNLLSIKTTKQLMRNTEIINSLNENNNKIKKVKITID